MFRAVITYTIGYGIDSKTIKADSFTELRTIVKKMQTVINENEFNLIGYKSRGKVYKVVFFYPSGKTYTQTMR